MQLYHCYHFFELQWRIIYGCNTESFCECFCNICLVMNVKCIYIRRFPRRRLSVHIDLLYFYDIPDTCPGDAEGYVCAAATSAEHIPHRLRACRLCGGRFCGRGDDVDCGVRAGITFIALVALQLRDRDQLLPVHAITGVLDISLRDAHIYRRHALCRRFIYRRDKILPRCGSQLSQIADLLVERAPVKHFCLGIDIIVRLLACHDPQCRRKNRPVGRIDIYIYRSCHRQQDVRDFGLSVDKLNHICAVIVSGRREMHLCDAFIAGDYDLSIQIPLCQFAFFIGYDFNHFSAPPSAVPLPHCTARSPHRCRAARGMRDRRV